MKRFTVAVPCAGEEALVRWSEEALALPLVERVCWLAQSTAPTPPPGVEVIPAPTFLAGAAVNQIVAACRTDYLLILLPGGPVELGARSLERILSVAEDTGAGALYADFRDEQGGGVSDHPLIDYQPGSIRDNFDFGPFLCLSRAAAERCGPISEELRWGGLYDLRLKLSVGSPVVRIPEPLATRATLDRRQSGERVFDYVDPSRRAYQVEMEQIATDHLRRIGAWLEPVFAPAPVTDEPFPVKASVVIPVRNRVKTVADAVRSALGQSAEFPFNVIAVDNHSTDGTTAALARLAAADARVVHLVPARTDLGIGGCWNEAIFSEHCGRYAVQLDSDDLYAGDGTLRRIVAEFDAGRYAMVIGSYTTVDFELRELPPGLIDHREWTRENGRNNALRINGLGAPRAFDVTVLRRWGLPNVSYGEDYAVALRVSREFEIGRIYESVYLARRWSGNSDSALPLPQMNRYDAYKDGLRTTEIRARQRLNARGGR